MKVEKLAVTTAYQQVEERVVRMIGKWVVRMVGKWVVYLDG